MSILTGPEIDKRRREGSIVIRPYRPEQLNPNSYDVRLAPILKCYEGGMARYENGPLDPRKQSPTHDIEIGPNGYTLYPGRLYLGSTVEYTETQNAVPKTEGKSSIGRLGIFVHVTAGLGDVGFRGYWTLELAVIEPVKVYAGMRIAQLVYHTVVGEIEPYKGRYQDNKGVEASKLYLGETV